MARPTFVKMRTGLRSDQRVGILATRIHATPDLAVGKLYALWDWAIQGCKDGVLAGTSLADLDQRLGQDGIGAALADGNWITLGEHGVVIADWGEHHSAAARARASCAARLRRHRRNGKPALAPVPTVDDDASEDLRRELERRNQAHQLARNALRRLDDALIRQVLVETVARIRQMPEHERPKIPLRNENWLDSRAFVLLAHQVYAEEFAS